MLRSLNARWFGPVLTAAARARLTGWLVANTTGGARLRAGLARTWRVGDKTGTGKNGTANDIGVLWPHANRRPILVTSYLTGAKVTQAAQYAAHADVARAIAAAVAGNPLPPDHQGLPISAPPPRCVWPSLPAPIIPGGDVEAGGPVWSIAGRGDARAAMARLSAAGVATR